jgi:hypothetical protein
MKRKEPCNKRFQLDAILMPCFGCSIIWHLHIARSLQLASTLIAARLPETAVIYNMYYRRLLMPEILGKVPFTGSFKAFPLP